MSQEHPAVRQTLNRRRLIRGAAAIGGLSMGGLLPRMALGADTRLPYGGQYLGCPSYGGGKANNGFWDRHSYRFVAEHSGGDQERALGEPDRLRLQQGQWRQRADLDPDRQRRLPLGPEARLHRRLRQCGDPRPLPGLHLQRPASARLRHHLPSGLPAGGGEPGHDLGQRSRRLGGAARRALDLSPAEEHARQHPLPEQRLEGDARADPDLRAHLRRRHRQGPAHDGRRPTRPAADRRRQHGPPELRHVRPVGHRLRHLLRPLPHRRGRPAHRPHHQQQQQGPLPDQRRRQPGEHLLLRRHLAPALALRADQPHHLRRRRHLLCELPGRGRRRALGPADQQRLFLRLPQSELRLYQPQRPVQHQRRGQLGLVAEGRRRRQQLDGACRSSSRPSPESPDSRHRAPGVWLPAGSAGGVDPPGTREQRRCRAGARSPTNRGAGPGGARSARSPRGMLP